jgi:hypothetical protein
MEVSVLMSEYHKIQTVYLRDPATGHKTLLTGRYSKPEFKYLENCEWIFTEKIDGMNMRVSIGANDSCGNGESDFIRINGKTDRAQIPGDLLGNMYRTFGASTSIDVLRELSKGGPAILYGEGFGPGIQTGSKDYPGEKRFILFDVKVGNFWLEWQNVQDVAKQLNIPTVPIVGYGNLYEMVDMARGGFASHVGDCVAEGIVARPMVEMFNRFGERVITKIKHKDFRR